MHYVKRKMAVMAATLVVTAVAVLTAVGCSQPADSSSVKVTGVTLNKNTLSLTVGGSETLTPAIQPSNATNKNVSWNSSNTTVATINNGTVNALAAGTATITVTTQDGGKTAQCTVTVTSGTGTAVTGVTLNKNTLSLTVGGSETLTPAIQPSNATNKNVSWNSSNTTVATVNNGTVSALAAGTATITVTTADGGKTAVCTVTVNNPTGSTSITINFNGPAEDIVLQSGNNDSVAVIFTVANAAQYGNFRWILDGVQQSETAGSITFNRADLAVGPHRLTVIASKGGTVYSREQKFTVSE
jgi:putative hemolysin